MPKFKLFDINIRLCLCWEHQLLWKDVSACLGHKTSYFWHTLDSKLDHSMYLRGLDANFFLSLDGPK